MTEKNHPTGVAQAAPEWPQPIATAPKDGTEFIAHQNGDVYKCCWCSEEDGEGRSYTGWSDFSGQSFEEPTEWQPLRLAAQPPAAPVDGEKAARDYEHGYNDGVEWAQTHGRSSAETARPKEAPEWIWYGEVNGSPVVSYGRWPKHGSVWRYKYAEIQPSEHDHGRRHQNARQALEKIISSLNYDGADTDSLTVGEIRRALAETGECEVCGAPDGQHHKDFDGIVCRKCSAAWDSAVKEKSNATK